MHSVSQKNIYGCGVACVAGVLGLSYEKARALFDDGEAKASTKGFYFKELKAVLGKFGFEHRLKYYAKLKRVRYSPGDIVFVARSKKYPKGHYLLRLEYGWMDPWINFPSDITEAKSGIRKRLPGRPVYILQK